MGGKDNRSLTQHVWKAMRERCTKPHHPSYPRYGGRGIKVCDRWNSYANFLADMGPQPAGLTLDRIDNDGHYEPGNCRWATRKQQAANTSRNVLVTFRGRTECISQWAKELGVGRNTLVARLERFPFDQVMSGEIPRHDNAHKTHCKRGHLLTETKWSGVRFCRECKQITQRANYHARQARKRLHEGVSP